MSYAHLVCDEVLRLGIKVPEGKVEHVCEEDPLGALRIRGLRVHVRFHEEIGEFQLP